MLPDIRDPSSGRMRAVGAYAQHRQFQPHSRVLLGLWAMGAESQPTVPERGLPSRPCMLGLPSQSYRPLGAGLALTPQYYLAEGVRRTSSVFQVVLGKEE